MLTLVAALCLQDTVEGSAADRLRQALDHTRTHASLRFEGATATDAAGIEEVPMLGGMMRGMGVLDGFFRGEIAGDGGTLHVTVEGETAVAEFFRRGDRTVQRAIWEGQPPMASPFMAEIGNLLNLEKVGEMVASATSVTAETDEQVGGHACSVYKASVPPEAWRAMGPPPPQPTEAQPPTEGQPPEGPRGGDPGSRFGRRGQGGAGMLMQALKTEEVRTTFWVDQESGLVRKVEVEVTRVPDAEAISRGFGRMGGRRGEGRGGEEEDPERAARLQEMLEGIEISSVHEIEFTGVSESGVEFPEEVDAFFNRQP